MFEAGVFLWQLTPQNGCIRKALAFKVSKTLKLQTTACFNRRTFPLSVQFKVFDAGVICASHSSGTLREGWWWRLIWNNNEMFLRNVIEKVSLNTFTLLE